MSVCLYRIVNGPCGCYGAIYTKQSAERVMDAIRSMHCHSFDNARIERVNGYLISDKYDSEK